MRLSLALVSLALSSTSVFATPPPDMIDAIESAKYDKHKRDEFHANWHKRHSGGAAHLEKKWVVLPNSALPGNLRPRPQESIFNREDASTTVPTNKLRKVVQRRGPPPTGAAPANASSPAPTSAPSGNSSSIVAEAPPSTSASVNPFDPFTWSQGVQAQYTSTKDHFNSLSGLSKVGLAAIIIVATFCLLALLVCTCKISRSRKRRREEKLRVKAEAAYLSRSTTGSSNLSGSTFSSSSHLNNNEKRSVGGGASGGKGDGVFGWIKKQTRTGDAGESMPEQDRLREMQQSSTRWGDKRAKSWDARAKGLGLTRGSPGKNEMVEAPQAPGGSMKTRNRSWAGPK